MRIPTDTPQVVIEHHLKALRLPTFLREYDKVARQCAAEHVDYPRYLLRMSELELLDRERWATERRATERRVRRAKFPAVKSLDSFDFLTIPFGEQGDGCWSWSARRSCCDAGTCFCSGTAAPTRPISHWPSDCQRGHCVHFTATAATVHEPMEARDEKKLLRYPRAQIAAYEPLIVDELGFVPLSKTGAALLFEVFSQRDEHSSTPVTSNLPF